VGVRGGAAAQQLTPARLPAVVRRYNRVRARFVEEHLPKDGVGVELGVFKGHFSTVLWRHARPSTLHLVDPWYLLTPEWHWGRGNRSTVDAVRRILRRWKREIEAGRVLVHVADDREVLRRFPDGHLDWAYVDSSHAYQHTKDELALLHRKVRAGGVISGDDWRIDPDHPHAGVRRAVLELVEEHGYEVLVADAATRQWAIRRAAGG
jgi:hypothetical protein